MPRAGSNSGWNAVRRAKRRQDNAPVVVPGDVLKCLDELGIAVDRIIGDEAIARCPGHLRRVGKNDRDPSWSVNLDTGMHNCFSCGFRGPFEGIVREVLNLPGNEAHTWVKRRGGLERIEQYLTGGYISDLTEPRKIKFTEADLALCIPPPVDVLATRGISAEAAAAYGVLYDPQKDCWITPIRDPATGKLWGWQEKAVVDRYFRNRPRHVEKSKTLFGIGQPDPGRRAVMVESPLDAVVMRTAGIHGALSSFGAAVSDDQMQLVLERFDELILALDNDPDGRKNTERIYDAWHRRLPILVMPYPAKVKDPGEMEDRQILNCLDAAHLPLWEKLRAHR
jgi:DNA primase